MKPGKIYKLDFLKSQCELTQVEFYSVLHLDVLKPDQLFGDHCFGGPYGHTISKKAIT